MVRPMLWGIFLMFGGTRKCAEAQGVLARSHVLSALDRQAVPDAGIGNVRAICNGTTDGCPSSDQQAAEGLASKLNSDEHVIGVGNVELGQLVCDSVDDALDSTLLRFAISSNETVIAERTTYEVYGGSVFTDGKERKVWMGDVVDPAPTTASSSRSVTMAWGEPCEVETFLLQVVTRNPDGTLRIIKSVPCSAGSSEDICMVEVDMEFKSEGDYSVTSADETSIQEINAAVDVQRLTEDNRRLLNAYSRTTNEENGQLYARGSDGLREKAGIMTPRTRRLQDTTKITLLVLYTTEAMTKKGVAAAQMMTDITAAFTRTNAALTASGISSLTFEVLKMDLFDQGSAGMVATVLAMDKDDKLTKLRNEAGADLVQMVGYFANENANGFGLLFHHIEGLSEVQEDRAFSAVNVDALEDESHTHELGHNLGCLHNRENSVGLIKESSHGYRVCDGDVASRFRTVMTYADGCTDSPRQNFFSTPDETFNGAPIGTATENNVKEILENMVAVSEYRCVDDEECDEDQDEICCPETFMCGVKGVVNPEACGDPHMTGFLGQKFDFTGEDGAWYALVSDLPAMHINMRVTTPVPSLQEITYITGLSLLTADADGLEHTVIIEVTDPHSISSACPIGVSPCLADGALSVTLDGEESLLAPGTAVLGPGVSVSAVNLPGECRSFGFEKYWERKKLEYAQVGRRLHERRQSMAEWVLGDPTVTNMAECMEYVDQAQEADGGLFGHQSEHGSFQIETPKATIRLSHGRLHQIAMRDPTDQFDLPDHLTWQMNMAINHNDVSHDATGVLGETMVPTRDENGNKIMSGMAAIRGSQEDYRVAGSLDTVFIQGPRG